MNLDTKGSVTALPTMDHYELFDCNGAKIVLSPQEPSNKYAVLEFTSSRGRLAGICIPKTDMQRVFDMILLVSLPGTSVWDVTYALGSNRIRILKEGGNLKSSTLTLSAKGEDKQGVMMTIDNEVIQEAMYLSKDVLERQKSYAEAGFVL